MRSPCSAWPGLLPESNFSRGMAPFPHTIFRFFVNGPENLILMKNAHIVPPVRDMSFNMSPARVAGSIVTFNILTLRRLIQHGNGMNT